MNGPADAPWILAHLASSDPAIVQSALDALEDGATQDDALEVLGGLTGLADQTVAARAARAVGSRGGLALIPALERLSTSATGPVAIAASESKGRIEERANLKFGDQGGAGVPAYRELAKAQNDAGLTLFRAGQWREALTRFVAARSLDPGWPAYGFNVGLTLHRLGDSTEGAALMVQAVDAGVAEPADVQITINVLRDLGHRQTLLQFLEDHLATIRRTDVRATLALNQAHEDLAAGDGTHALAVIEAALSRAVPDAVLPALLDHQGDAYLAAGDVENGRRSFTQVLSLLAGDHHAMEGMKRVEALASTPAPAAPAAGTVTPAPTGDELTFPDEDPDRLLSPQEPAAPGKPEARHSPDPSAPAPAHAHAPVGATRSPATTDPDEDLGL